MKTHTKLTILAMFAAAAGLSACGQEGAGGASSLQEWQTQYQQRGVDLTAYCKRQYGSNFFAKLVGSTTGDWVCETDPHNTRAISVKQACIWQQNTDKVGFRDRNDPTSWYCLVPVQVWVPVHVGVNIDAYCKRQYGQSFSAKLTGSTALDWVCETDAHNTRPVSIKQACEWQQNTSKVGYTNVNDPLSWYCEI